MTTQKPYDTDTSSMRGFASGAQLVAARPDPYAGKEQVFVPAYEGDKPDSDTSSMRGYRWLPKGTKVTVGMP